MNRLDRLIVFRTLKPEHLERILDIELNGVQNRITKRANIHGGIFVFHCTPAARALLLREGTNAKYGARELRRAVERYITSPLSTLLVSGQVETGDEVVIDYQGSGELEFLKVEHQTAAWRFVDN